MHYSDACESLARLRRSAIGVPSPRRRRARARCAWIIPATRAPLASPARALPIACSRNADLVLALGTRLQDFTTGSGRLFTIPTARLDLDQRRAPRRDQARRTAVRGDAAAHARGAFAPALEGWAAGRSPGGERIAALAADGTRQWMRATPRRARACRRMRRCSARSTAALGAGGTVVCAAGGLPGELHKLWRCARTRRLSRRVRLLLHGLRDCGRARRQAGGPGPRGRVLVGDGSYLMMNSEIATSVARGLRSSIVLARQSRLRLHPPPAARNGGRVAQQPARGVLPRRRRAASILSRMRARWARTATKVDGHRGSSRLQSRRRSGAARTTVIVIETDPQSGTGRGRCLVERAGRRSLRRRRVRTPRTRVPGAARRRRRRRQ